MVLALWVSPPTPKSLLGLNFEKGYQHIHVFLLLVISQDQKGQTSVELPLDLIFVAHSFRHMTKIQRWIGCRYKSEIYLLRREPKFGS